MSHHVSIGPRPSVSSNPPENSTVGSKISSSSSTVSLPIADTGSNIVTTSDAVIKEPIVRKEKPAPLPLPAFSGEVPSKHNYRASSHPGSVSHAVRYIYPEGIQNSRRHSYPKISDDEESISPSSSPGRSPSSKSRVDGSIQSPLRHPIPDDGLEGTTCASECFSTVTSENSRDCTESASQHSGTPLPIFDDEYFRRSPSPVNVDISSVIIIGSGSHPESDASPGDPRPQTNEDILSGIHPKSDVGYNLNAFCNELRHSPEAEHAKVTSILRYATGGRTMHRFLILHAVKKSGQIFFIRLDRRPRTQELIKLSSQSYMPANDQVKLALSRMPLLYEPRLQEEAIINFNAPVPLKLVAKALDVIRDESVMYALSRENCWFFASIIQEVAVQFLGGRFSEAGKLNDPTLARRRRKVIKEKVYTVLPAAVPILVSDIESLVVVTHDELLIEAFWHLARIIEAQDKLLHCSSLSKTESRKAVGSRMIGLLYQYRQVVYEHMHALSGVPWARRLRPSFPKDLNDYLTSWESTLGFPPSKRILEESQTDTLVLRVTGVLSEAFDPTTERSNMELKTNSLQLRWIRQECSSLADLDLAFWIIEHLSLCESLQPLSERHRFRLKEDIPGLQEEFNSVLPATVQFACKSWCLLTCRLMCTDSRIIGALDRLVRRWLPHWIAAMGIMGEVDDACQGLHQVEQWMRERSGMEELQLHTLNVYRFILRSKKALCQSPFLVFSGTLPFGSASRTEPSTTPKFSVVKAYDAVLVTAAGPLHDWTHTPMRLRNHPNPVCSLAYSPDGARLASAFRDKCIWVWNIGTGTRQFSKDLPSVCIFVLFSPDGSQIACALENGSIYLCDPNGAGEPRHLSGHSKRVNSLSFSPYGTRLASASGDKTIRLWDNITSSPTARILEGHTDAVVSIVFSPDGTRLASASYDHTFRIWDAASGDQVGSAVVPAVIFCVAFHPDSERVILACNDASVYILNIFEMKDLLLLRTHGDAVYSVSCSVDGNWIASASADATVCLWRTDGSKWIHHRTLADHAGRVYGVAFSPKANQIASASRDRSICIWDLEAPGPRDVGDPFPIASNAQLTAFVNQDRIIRIKDSNLDEPPILRGHTDWITCVCFSPDNLDIVSASRDLSIRVWDISSGRCIKKIDLTDIGSLKSRSSDLQAPYNVSYLKDGLVLRVCGWNNSEHSEGPYTIYLDSGTWTEIPTLRPDAAFAPMYQPDLAFLIVLDRNCLCTPHEDGLAYICWLPDDFEPISDVMQIGRRVSVGDKGGEVVHINFDEFDVDALW